jgi:iduronate 2-sulfatase
MKAFNHICPGLFFSDFFGIRHCPDTETSGDKWEHPALFIKNCHVFVCGSVLMLLPLVVSGKERKNVLFIAVDDLRPTLGCYDDSTAITPNIDLFAEKSFLFRNAYCQQAVSGPSRSSLLTGLYPDHIGVTDLNSHFRNQCPDIITLPQFFKNNGYTAVGIGKIYHGTAGMQDSISWSEPPLFNLSTKKDEYLLSRNRTGKKATAVEVAGMPEDRFIDGRITQEALSRLEQFAGLSEPFFLAIGYIKPHLPFSMPRKYHDLHAGKDFQTNHTENLIHIPSIAFHDSEELRGYTDIPDSEEISGDKARELITGYYACVSFIDEQIGRLIKQLETLKLDRNTVIVLWGDNGFHLGEQGLWCKSTNFEAACKVPLLIYDPQYGTGRKIEDIVELIDIYPTLAEMCGFKAPGHLQGQSLCPLTMQWEEGKNRAFSQFPRPYGAVHSSTRQTHMGYTVRIKDWRCTLWYDVVSGELTDRELYRYIENGSERENLSGRTEHAATENELSSLIETFRNNHSTIK